MAHTQIKLRSLDHDNTTEVLGHTQIGTDIPVEGILPFVHILGELKIPNANPCILNAERLLATSGTLGKGAQYLVDQIYDNQRWPEDLDPSSARSVVYKRAYTTLSGSRHDTAARMTTLEALTREVSVLGRLRETKNIVQLLGIAWEGDERYDDIKPVIVLEYAKLGSLASMMSSQSDTSWAFQQKMDLCGDIATGMATVHAHKFIWGDCKPENVLIFPDDSRIGGLRAKIGDFGVCEPEPTPNTFFRGVSRPWTAPEADPSLPGAAQGFEALVRAEVYAFGLLAWAIVMDGRQFQRILWDARLQATGSSHRPNMTSGEIESLKCSPDKHALFVEAVLSSVKVHLLRDHGQAPIASPVGISSISNLLNRCIVYDPRARLGSMAGVLEHLGLEMHSVSHNSSSLSHFSGSLDHSYLMSSYGSQTKLSPVAAAIFRELQSYIDGRVSGPACFQNSLCYLTGFGTPQNFIHAVEMMRRSAGIGYKAAQGIFGRLQSVCQLAVDEQTQQNMLISDSLIDFDDIGTSSDSTTNREMDVEATWVLESALAGSWIAACDLFDQDPGLHAARVGTSYERIGREPVVASCGSIPALYAAILNRDEISLGRILDSRAIDINSQDSNGETALTLAMRTGQPNLAEALLKCGASMDILDLHGVSSLHWIISLQEHGIELIEEYLKSARPNIQSSVTVQRSPHWGTRLEPGTPLDWAIDVRNTAAVSFLISKLDASAFVETNGRIPALHRAWARHDAEICQILLTKNKSMPMDSHGNSPVAYSLCSEFSVERLLYPKTTGDSLSSQLDLLSQVTEEDFSMNYVNSLGESALYYATKQNDAGQTKTLIKWLREHRQEHLLQPNRATGQNIWSVIGRAVYSDNTLALEEFCDMVDHDGVAKIVTGFSPDGLSIMHELAFIASDSTPSLVRVFDVLCQRLDAWQHNRLLQRGKRPRLTPFQMAVLCHNFQLADLCIDKGAEPLDGIEKSRFLGFLIGYQSYSAYELSTWLSYVNCDPVPNSLRRFPHPTTVGRAIEYVLRHDMQWWDLKRSGGWTKRYFEDPEDDRDPVHDPMISWRPGFTTAFKNSVLVDSRASRSDRLRSDQALQLYGTEGWFDSNQLAFHHRSRHAADFKSFLTGYRQNIHAGVDYGHKFVTALELAFHMVVTSAHKDHAISVFKQVLAHYNGPAFCNFPYYYYFPLGRTRWRNLVRRETLLHQAIRFQLPVIVSALLENGADWEMADSKWHSPLQLADLIGRDKIPDLARGSFLQRLGPSLPPLSFEGFGDEDDTPATQVKLLIEGHIVGHRHKALFGPRPWAFLRALREVRWPWSEYETDDLGVRFLLFYLLVLVLLAVGVGAPAYFVTVAVPRALTSLIKAIKSAVDGFTILADCYMDARARGVDPRQACTDLCSEQGQAFVAALNPPIHYLRPVIDAYIDQWDTCFDGELPPWVHNKSAGVEIPTDSEGSALYIPGCPAEFYGMALNSTPVRLLNSKLSDYVDARCKCTCKAGWTPVHEPQPMPF